ncbi:MAG TPA: Clp protease N-terminal domain-containing protein [Sandaracinaceae bacterium LLY-WYZ-13_1]|nr:Clp protease N-terminal domain-containing protein [Sandaracinaceae bacterium LLY-WYZ-13_1]
MSLEAIAVVKIPPAEVRRALEAMPEAERPAVRALDDATAVPLGMDLTASPDALGARLRELLGDALDAHGSPKGVPLHPASHVPEATSYDAVVEELGAGADWIPSDALAPAEATEDPFAALSGALSGAGVDLNALAGQVQGQDPNALMETAMGLVQQLAQSGQLEDVQQAMMQSMGGMGMDPSALLARSGVDLEQLQRMAQDPATLERLGVSPEQLEEAFRQTGGDPQAALAKLGVTPEKLAAVAPGGEAAGDGGEADGGGEGG